LGLPSPITPKESGRGFLLGSFKNLGFSVNIYAIAENSDFEFGAQLWFANYTRHKIT